MKNSLLILVALSFVMFTQCKEKKKYHDVQQKNVVNEQHPAIKAILEFQNTLNKEFKNPETSPLLDKHRKNFEGLDFFAPDTAFIVVAKFTRTPDAIPFLMPSTTELKSKEVVYGTVTFKLHQKSYTLELYQNEELILEAGYEDYLFLPFTDDTNGEETYGGGRYIDMKIPKSETMVINFNRAYNPYCVYNKKYSCPLVPSANNLNTEIKAGVKAFAEAE